MGQRGAEGGIEGRAAGATAAVSAIAAADLFSEYAFLLAGGVAREDLERACSDASVSGIAPHWRLFHSGELSAQRYLELLEADIALLVPRGTFEGTEIVDALAGGPRAIAATAAAVRGRGRAPLFLLRQQIDWSEAPHSRRFRVEHAANGLKRRQPEMSAGSRFVTWQLLAAPTLVGFVAGGLAVMPQTTLAVMAGLVALPFLFIVGLRVLSLIVALRLPVPQRLHPQSGAQAGADTDEGTLPVYSVLVPMFREADVLPDTIAALGRLDYPTAKLDILLILESVDGETRSALGAIALPPHMRVIVVPDVQPRTKPKALNYALRLARGEYVVIYDAEDDPDPDQLRRAAAAFARGPADLMCLQGRLAMDNREPGWIARQFMLEYAALFDAMLPAMARLGLPLPLGGTSNHFPRRVLEDLGGWDAWNVTEDADLGIRIARRGGRVGVLDSTTYEEAPERFDVWLKQRTRWLKGFMQTWLVHMRRPGRLWRELGPWGFLGFNAFLGGLVLSALIHPIFLVLLLAEVWSGNLMALPDSVLGSLLMALAVFNLAGGYGSGMAITAVAASRRGMVGLLPHLALMPLYWVMISLAAYRAALQLGTNPYLWEKTPHTSRKKRGGGRTEPAAPAGR